MVDIKSKPVLKRLKEAVIQNPSIELKRIAGGIFVFITIAGIAVGINELIKEDNNYYKGMPIGYLENYEELYTLLRLVEKDGDTLNLKAPFKCDNGYAVDWGDNGIVYASKGDFRVIDGEEWVKQADETLKENEDHKKEIEERLSK